MSVLFEPIEIGGMLLRNRFVRSATYDATATEEGEVTDRSIGLLTDLAKGEVGLIIAGFAYVQRDGQTLPCQNGIYDDTLIPALRRLTAAAHEHGAKIALQIGHCGAKCFQATVTGESPLAPSGGDGIPGAVVPPRSMNTEEIESVIDAFGQAARRTQEAGFDAVQFHGAHGYLISEFLSPATNLRTDEWGGSLENRMRFLIELYREVRRKVGDDYPVLVKLGVKDHSDVHGGLPLSEGCEVARVLSESGMTAIEVSGGMESTQGAHIATGIKSREQEAYYRDLAKEVRKAASVPLILVGGLRSLDIIEGIVQEDIADCVALSRPFIREPDLVNRWRSGDTRRSACISCRGCFAQEGGRLVIKCSQIEPPGEQGRVLREPEDFAAQPGSS